MKPASLDCPAAAKNGRVSRCIPQCPKYSRFEAEALPLAGREKRPKGLRSPSRERRDDLSYMNPECGGAVYNPAASLAPWEDLVAADA
jgi:hypothetical protein